MIISTPFEIGIFNLWICTAMIFLIPEIVNRLSGMNWRRACRLPKMSFGEKIIYFGWIGINMAIYAYSLFVPVIMDSIWFYPGLLLFVASLVVLIMGTYAYQTTPQEKLVIKGIYKISRNPGYFGSFCAYVAMGLMSSAWPIILLAFSHLALYQVTVRYEERMCKELYPDEFPGYKLSVKKNFWII